MKKILNIIFLAAVLLGCDRLYDSPVDDGRVNSGLDEESPKFYMEQYDALADVGQYNHPDGLGSVPETNSGVYGLFGIGQSTINDPDVPGGVATNAGGAGLQYHLLSQSFAAHANESYVKGLSTAPAWLDAYDAYASYKDLMKTYRLGATWLVHTGNPMTNPGFGPLDGYFMEQFGKRYVLTDVRNNPESGNVAIVASHVYDAFIVDTRDQEFYDANGFEMVYDATQKTTADSWREFKEYCNNDALVVMPVHTGEMADFAIVNKLFVVNLNKLYNTASGGQNVELFKEILAWLKPNSPVYGWEPGVGEDEFVRPVSRSGNMMVALSEFNVPFFSANYKNLQKPVLAKVKNPATIDFSTNASKRFVSYYLSDGAHSGWMLRGFMEQFYQDPMTDEVKMSYGINATNISQIAPQQFEKIINSQSKNSSLIESFGGGYWYSDDFAIDSDNRPALLKSLAENVAAYMRQHRIKVLEQIAHDPHSAAAMETYQAFVDANDQLEGIIAIQYAPSYAACGGDIMWVTNKAGYDIPIITVSYSIWNFGSTNKERDGSPTYIANKLNAKSDKFSAVIIHAWSNFADTGDSMDELAENVGGDVRGASAAQMCHRRLADDYEAVTLQELIWRVRMEYRPEQTERFLNEYF